MHTHFMKTHRLTWRSHVVNNICTSFGAAFLSLHPINLFQETNKKNMHCGMKNKKKLEGVKKKEN